MTQQGHFRFMSNQDFNIPDIKAVPHTQLFHRGNCNIDIEEGNRAKHQKIFEFCFHEITKWNFEFECNGAKLSF